LAGWLRRRAENVAAALLAVMFLAFIVQVASRYLFNHPLGWPFELSILCWLWGVLFGAAFVVRERDEIRFDLVLGAVPRRVRRLFALATGLALVAIYLVSLPAVADYVGFMRVERTAYMKIPFDLVFAAYLVFALASIGRYAWLALAALRGRAPASAAERGSAGSAL
jgi:C4-dicarboxylate transporter, DctQ subunit